MTYTIITWINGFLEQILNIQALDTVTIWGTRVRRTAKRAKRVHDHVIIRDGPALTQVQFGSSLCNLNIFHAVDHDELVELIPPPISSIMTSPLELYEPLDVIGNGSFGIIRKVRRRSDGLVSVVML